MLAAVRLDRGRADRSADRSATAVDDGQRRCRSLSPLATVRLLPSFNVNPAAVKPPRVATWLVVAAAPVSAVAPVELPVSVPAISVPVSPIVPPVAIRLTVPAPPSVTSPGDRDARCRSG